MVVSIASVTEVQCETLMGLRKVRTSATGKQVQHGGVGRYIKKECHTGIFFLFHPRTGVDRAWTVIPRAIQVTECSWHCGGVGSASHDLRSTLRFAFSLRPAQESPVPSTSKFDPLPLQSHTSICSIYAALDIRQSHRITHNSSWMKRAKRILYRCKLIPSGTLTALLSLDR